LEERPTHNSEDDPWTEVIAIIEALHGIDNLGPAQAGILNGGQLMAHLIAHFVYREVLMLLQVRIKLGPWKGMSDRDLNRFAVKLLGKLEGTLDGLGRLPWQPDDQISMHYNAQLLTVFHKRSGLFDGRPFLDIGKNLRSARLKAHNHQAAP